MGKKKHPSDYPQLTFRVSDDDKKRINELVEEVVTASNAKLDPANKLFRKNDVYVDALFLGLLTLKQKGLRLSKFKG